MSNVCQDQESMNKAIKKTIIQSIRENRPSQSSMTFSLIIMILLIFFSVSLALRVPPNVRQIHVMFAIIFSPFYIISYYINRAMKN
jgi:hypothetical protein